PAAPVELSEIERRYAERADRPLRLVGRQAFGSARPVTLRQTGAVPEDYLLGQGDEIVVALRGQVSRTFRARVDRNGMVVFPELPPVPAAGLRFGEFREALQAQIAARYVASDAYVSIGEVWQTSLLDNRKLQTPVAVALN